MQPNSLTINFEKDEELILDENKTLAENGVGVYSLCSLLLLF